MFSLFKAIITKTSVYNMQHLTKSIFRKVINIFYCTILNKSKKIK